MRAVKHADRYAPVWDINAPGMAYSRAVTATRDWVRMRPRRF